MALKDITDKIAPVWQALNGIATGSKIISSEWNTVIENIAERTQFLRRRGICDWDSTLSYVAGDFVQSAGEVYKALTANLNKSPASNPSNWEKCPMLVGELASATAPIVNGVASPGSASTFSRADHVHPTDTTRATAANFANSKTANGWQKLEGGLIIQWGTVGFAANNSTAVQTTVAFPIAFPNACVHISGVQTSQASNAGGGTWAMRPTNKTLTNFLAVLDCNAGVPQYYFMLHQTAEWIALGY